MARLTKQTMIELFEQYKEDLDNLYWTKERELQRYFNGQLAGVEKRLEKYKENADRLVAEAERVASRTTIAADDVLAELSIFIKECKTDRERTEKKLREAEEKIKSMEDNNVG